MWTGDEELVGGFPGQGIQPLPRRAKVPPDPVPRAAICSLPLSRYPGCCRQADGEGDHALALAGQRTWRLQDPDAPINGHRKNLFLIIVKGDSVRFRP